MSDRDEFERERLVALIIDVGMMRRDVASDVAAAILDRWHLASKVEDAVWKQAYETDIASNFITKDELAALAAMSDPMENYPYVSEGTLKAPAIAQRGHAIIDYTNWRGERSTREIVPLGNWKLCSNEWHPDEQWMMLAHDVAKGEDRWFALSGIHSWQKK